MEDEIYCYGCMRPLDREGAVCPYCGYDNSVSQNGEDLLPEGTVLSGKYLVGKRLGRGGFGVTYLGYDLMLKRVIAIKEYFPLGISTRSPRSGNVLASSGAKIQRGFSRGLKAFQEEAQNLARFDDRSIVRVRDFHTENGTAYIIMNFVRGKDLATEIEECGRISWERVLELFNPLIQEMEILHRNHLIHRDIKPANIKIVPATDSRPEHLVLLDFGSARSYISENVTGTYTAMLTPGYAPIEQYSSQSRQGPFTDVYGICATMYHALTGEIPPVVTDIVTGEADLKSFADFGLDVPETIEKAIFLGLTVSPGKRTATMQELYDQLNGLAPVPDPNVTVNPYLNDRDDPDEPGNDQPEMDKPHNDLPDTGSEIIEKPQKDLTEKPLEKDSDTEISGPDPVNPGGTNPITERPKPSVDEDRKKHVKILPIILAAAVIGVLVWFLVLRKPDPPVPTPTPTVSVPTSTAVPAEDVLTNTSEPTGEVPSDTPEPTEEIPTDTPEPTETVSPDELYRLGQAAYEEANFADAFKYLVPAADAGSSDAQALLGYMYEYGTGLDEPDYDLALKYYQQSADQGNAEGQTWLGQMYEYGTGMDRPDYDAALKSFQMAADQGYAEAQTDLAWMYFYGEGMDSPDYETAFSYYQKAADQGYARAQSWLAFMYEKGYGMDAPDLDMAEQYYQMAADQGYTTASVSLSALRRRRTEEALTATAEVTATPTPSATPTLTSTSTPTPTPSPTPTSASTSTPAATMTSAPTAPGFTPKQLYTLGKAAFDREDYDSAYRYLIPAADAEHADSQVLLAYMYEHSRGLDEPDYANALKYYQLAADQGNKVAQNNLGFMYWQGEGMDQPDYALALYYYRLAVEQGNEYAMRNLAYMYEKGQGMDQPDYEMAEHYYQMAVENGNTEAASDLESLRKKMPQATATPKPDAEYAVVQVDGDYGVLMRSTPSSSGSVMQAVLNGGRLEITGEAVSADGINWLPVRTDTGLEGWVPESALGLSESDTGSEPGPVAEPLDLHTGDIFTFGSYEQDNDPNNGPEPIEWQVLAVEDGRALLISKAALDAKTYHNGWTSVTWEGCSLREWLNGEFFSTAFTSAEQARIPEVSVENPDNATYGTEGGNSTTDRIFLLSIDEAKLYFSGNTEWRCEATEYARSKNVNISSNLGTSWWWLRSPGSVSDNAASVNYAGVVDAKGHGVVYNSGAVRPAFWIELGGETPHEAEVSEMEVSLDFGDVKAGDVITFGHYEQDNDPANGPEAIEWQVLTVEDGQALVLSLYGLDTVKYNETREGVTWETCSLRPWLNGTFFSTAFSSEEASRIALTTVHTPMFRNVPGGNDTEDRLFLLSVEEMNTYFTTDESRRLEATAYAMENGGSVNVDNGKTWWWVRNPWGEGTEAAVSYEGSLWSVGLWVDMDFVTVRPAFWLNL